MAPERTFDIQFTTPQIISPPTMLEGSLEKIRTGPKAEIPQIQEHWMLRLRANHEV
jgi:hypothetical protein